MFQYCFLEFLLMSLWRIFIAALMFLIRTLMIRSLFKVLVSETFMFLYCVSDDSLMILRRSLVDTAKISMQTVMMICLFEVQIFETLMFFYCFIDDSMMILWLDIDEHWRFRCKHFWLVKFLLCYSSKPWGFIAAWLFIRWWVFEETSMRHWWFR